MIEMDTLAEKIFSLLKGNGLKIKIFDNDGAEVTDPKTGRRFFVLNPNIMLTINEDDNIVEFSKGKSVEEDSIAGLQKNVRKIADEFLMNLNIKVFGKSIQPRDYAYQAKMQKETTMMENNTIQPHNHQLLGKVLHKVRFFGDAQAYTLADDLGLPLADIQKVLNILVKDGKITATPNPHGDLEYSASVEEAVMEDSDKKAQLAQVMKHSAVKGQDNRDLTGYTAGNKHGQKNVPKVDKFAFPDKAPDQVKKKPMTPFMAVSESLSKMFGSKRTSQQTLENVKILVKHKTPVDENVRGARTRHISAIFLECNGERLRFQHNYLPGARAMAQHLAHGGTMSDKVGSYISESIGQMLKLQSFNRYVTSNNLINEDSSGIVETVKENIQQLKTELQKLIGTKTYETARARIETFEKETLAEDDTSQLKDLFTIRRFDEKFDEVLPIVKQLVQERDTYRHRIEEAASKEVMVRRDAISTTPMFEFASENARLGFKLNELALRIVENDELAGFVNKIGTKMCKEGTINQFEHAVLSQVLENIKVSETSAGRKEIKESMEIDTFFDRYTDLFPRKK